MLFRSFDTKLNSSAAQTVVGVISGKPEHYQNSDLEHIDEPLPGSGIGGVKLPSAGITATAQSQNVAGDMGISGGADATIGGSSTSGVNGSQDQFTRLEKFVDPFLHLTISTCLGSLILSVKYIIPSSILTPVIIKVEENFKALDVALTQTKTGCISFVSSLYSAIASIVVPDINQ